ncbi:SDR family oxidoreductase [Bradyrhizobium sp. 14AA]
MTTSSIRLVPNPGSRVLIAGGCGGIGRELTKACVSLDLDVTVLDIAPAIEAATREDNVHYICFDGRDAASIRGAVAECARDRDSMDAFFFLSGFTIGQNRRLAEVALEKWNELITVNLTSAYLLVNEVTPLLRKATAPAIITVVSSLAYQPRPGMGPYAASKGGLVTLTKAFASELAPQIRVNAVAPGAVDTEFLSGGTGRTKDLEERSSFEAGREKYESLIPLGRMATPTDVVGPMLFLSSPASAYMTGQVLHLNGGRLTP